MPTLTFSTRFVYEYVPDFNLMFCDKAYHGWMYTGVELNALHVVRHKEGEITERKML